VRLRDLACSGARESEWLTPREPNGVKKQPRGMSLNAAIMSPTYDTVRRRTLPRGVGGGPWQKPGVETVASRFPTWANSGGCGGGS